jgi:hypothetical protein
MAVTTDQRAAGGAHHRLAAVDVIGLLADAYLRYCAKKRVTSARESSSAAAL